MKTPANTSHFLNAVVHLMLAARTASTPLLSALDGNAGTDATAEDAPRPIGVVIMAQGRSGSTMLGETFRQNKDVLYWYEPCRAWGQGLFDSSSLYHREIHGEECSDLVRRLARCKFTLEDAARLGVDPAALESGSPALRPLAVASTDPTLDVLARAYQAVVEECKQSRAVVVKTIRADAGVGGDDGDASGLLVVHLVRDPRAVIHSQIKTFNVAHKYRHYFNNRPAEGNGVEQHTPGDINNATEGDAGAGDGLKSLPWGGPERAHALGLIICGVYRNQLDSSENLGEDRYLRVRYEDIAASAESAVERVYRWSGLGPVPSRVSIWVHENTRVPDCGDSSPDAADFPRVKGSREASREITEAIDGISGDLGVSAVGDIRMPELEAAKAEVAAAIQEGTRRKASGNGGGGGDGGANEDAKCRERMAKQAEWDKYGTRRHAAAMVGLWRAQMPAEEATTVWEACTGSGVMATMGYIM